MKRQWITGLCVALATLAAPACATLGAGGSDPAAPASLAGSWTLNAGASSDTSRASVRGLERGPIAVPDGGRTTARPPGTYGERLRAAGVAGELAVRVLAAARTHIDRLTITDSAGAILLRAGDDRRVAVQPGGGTARQSWLDGTSGAVRARWVEHRLEIVRRLDGGITVQEYYAPSPGGGRLVVFTIVRGPFDGEITLRRVYDRTAG